MTNSNDIKHELFQIQKSICPICNKKMDLNIDTAIDHIIPCSCKDDDSIDNLQLVHFKCNAVKGAFNPRDVFYHYTTLQNFEGSLKAKPFIYPI